MLRVSKVWTFSIQMGFALVAVVLAGSFTRIQAAPTCTTTDVLPGGVGTVSNSLLVPGFCVLSTDKLYGNWSVSSLPGGGTSNFTINAIGDHSITFAGTFIDGANYTPSYEVSVTNPLLSFVQLRADITQTSGVASLTVVTSPPGSGTISILKVANSVSGNAITNYSTFPTDLIVNETFLPAAGSDASAILNTFVEGTPTVPEPATLELLGIALTGIGIVGLRRKPSL